TVQYARVWRWGKTRCRTSLSEACVRQVTVGLHGRLSVHASVLPRYQSQGPNKDFDALRHIGRSLTWRQATGGAEAA
ncbi:hypothetical protein PspLS_05596, partial [Pyricularia sp. CBS 133598]